MKKERAIEVAEKKTQETGVSHYVTYDPEYYREIFNNTGFKVISQQQLDELLQDYSRDAIVVQ